MGCKIIVPLSGKDPNKIFDQAVQLVAQHGKFNKTGPGAGDFEINIPLLRNIKGHLIISDATMNIDIVENPNSISCDMIEEEIKSHL